MNIPIEDKILKKANVRFATASFLTLGAIAVGVTTNMAFAGLASIAFPFVLDGFLTRTRLKKRDSFALDGGILTQSYKKMFRSWFSEYINDSTNLTEKKYKAICVNLWLRHKRLNGRSILSGNDDFIDKLSYELKDNFETSKLMYSIFESHTVDTHPLDFLLEDENDEEKKKIARKIYGEFSQAGMAGEAFLWGGRDFEVLMKLQDYMLTDQDMQIIKNYVIEEENNVARYGFHAINPYNPCSDEDLLYKIVESEVDTKKLSIIKHVYELGSDSILRMGEKETKRLINFIDNKIKTTDLKEELVKDLPNNAIKPVKRNKI